MKWEYFRSFFFQKLLQFFWHISGTACIICLVLSHFMVYFVAGCITLNISCMKWSPLREILVTFLSKGHLLPAVFPSAQQSKHQIKINLDLHTSMLVNQVAGNIVHTLQVSFPHPSSSSSGICCSSTSLALVVSQHYLVFLGLLLSHASAIPYNATLLWISSCHFLPQDILLRGNTSDNHMYITTHPEVLQITQPVPYGQIHVEPNGDN